MIMAGTHLPACPDGGVEGKAGAPKGVGVRLGRRISAWDVEKKQNGVLLGHPRGLHAGRERVLYDSQE